MKAVEIEWDLEDDAFEYNNDCKELPTKVEIPDWVTKGCETHQEICDAVVDYLSDEYGYCVIEFGLVDMNR